MGRPFAPPRPEERLLIPRSEVEDIERDILRRRHVERYAAARQFVHGVVLDAACGCGYGTHILAQNPDVVRAWGIDTDAAAIKYAAREYGGDRIGFLCGNLGSVRLGSADVLVSIETIEHLEDPNWLNDAADAHDVTEVVLSYPLKKTTHYNPFHKWDLTRQDVVDLFPAFVVWKEFTFQYDTAFVCMVRHERSGAAPRRWSPR